MLKEVERSWKDGFQLNRGHPGSPVIADCPAPPVSPNQPKRRSPQPPPLQLTSLMMISRHLPRPDSPAPGPTQLCRAANLGRSTLC